MTLKWHLIFFVSVLISFSCLLSACFKTSDEGAYEEVLELMSLNKAKAFFKTYKKSEYRDCLVNQIIEWCEADATQECYAMILKVIPKNHARYNEVAQHEK